MSQEPTKPDETPNSIGEKSPTRSNETAAPIGEKSPPPSRPDTTAAPIGETVPGSSKPAKGSRWGAIIVVILIVVSLAWYLVSDRLTPYTSQARVQAFVVPVAAEVSGRVLNVYVKNNDVVQPGQQLFDIDPTQYKIALQRSRSDYESVRLSVNASTASVEAARASLKTAEASRIYAQQDATRLEQIYAEDPGALSVRRVQNAQTSRATAQSQEKKAEADLRRAQETAGASGDKNAQLLSARAAIEKAEWDLKRTQVVAPAGGSVTDLRTDAGHYMHAGSAAMTLIAMHDLWISADMTENNLGNVKPGDEVAIGLDVMPGEVLKGRVRSVGTGISPGSQPPPGTLPQVQNSKDWLRQSQRFPVAIEFDPSERERLGGVRIGGQADVLVYTGDHPVMNWLAGVFIKVMSYFSYFY